MWRIFNDDARQQQVNPWRRPTGAASEQQASGRVSLDPALRLGSCGASCAQEVGQIRSRFGFIIANSQVTRASCANLHTRTSQLAPGARVATGNWQGELRCGGLQLAGRAPTSTPTSSHGSQAPAIAGCFRLQQQKHESCV